MDTTKNSTKGKLINRSYFFPASAMKKHAEMRNAASDKIPQDIKLTPNKLMTMTSRELKEEEIADLKEAFSMFDINGDGES